MIKNPHHPFIFEVCANSVASAIAAQEGGAHRVELCENLNEGGTTPSFGSIARTRKSISIGVHVLIRPRGGDFLYTQEEFAVMREDIHIAKDLGVDGVVLGILCKDGTVDRNRTKELVEYARPLSVTFHRAFDVTRDPYIALQDIIELGCDRILTSGQANKATEGTDLIAALIHQAGDSITILVGSGVNEDNIVELLQKTHAWEFHGSAQKQISSTMQYQHPRVSMSNIPQHRDDRMAVTDQERVRKIISRANRFMSILE